MKYFGDRTKAGHLRILNLDLMLAFSATKPPMGLLLFVHYPSSTTRQKMSASNFRNMTPTRTIQILSSIHWMNQS